MYYAILVIDGLADSPGTIPSCCTPMSAADTPNVRELTAKSYLGRTQTCPKAYIPGSDVANMSMMGYDPKKYYNGRAPIEAHANRIEVPEHQTVTRMNFISISEDEKSLENCRMLHFDAGGVSDAEAAELIKALETAASDFSALKLHFASGFHHLIVSDDSSDATFPHEFVGECLAEHFPTSARFRKFIYRSNEILARHPVNLIRKKAGKPPINAAWPWGSGRAMILPNFRERTGLRACMITATDVLRGLAVAADLDVIQVDGATATINTNYRGKAEAAIHALLEAEYDFVYIHIEASDAAGHAKCSVDKVKVYENVDSDIVKPLLNALAGTDFRLLLLPDHYTCSDTGKHSGEPVPYLFYDSTTEIVNTRKFSEEGVAEVHVIEALDLFKNFISPASSVLKSA